jgi:methionine-rich copper-binding protein CopC
MAPRLRFFYILFLSLIALFSVQPSATAHVAVVSTSPQENSTLEQMPERVVIEFNEPLLIIGAGKPNSLAVTSKSGVSATTGRAQVRGSTISIALNQTLTEGGPFTVSYRVVSSDGHKVSDSYEFTVVNDEAEIVSPTPTTVPAAGQNQRNSLPVYWISGVLALLGIGSWALYRARFARRK